MKYAIQTKDKTEALKPLSLHDISEDNPSENLSHWSLVRGGPVAYLQTEKGTFGKDLAVLLSKAPEMLTALAGCADALKEAGKDFAKANPRAARPNLYELHERQARVAIAKAMGEV